MYLTDGKLIVSSINVGETTLATGNQSGIKLGNLGQLAAAGFESSTEYRPAELQGWAKKVTIFDIAPKGSKQRYGVVIQRGTVTDSKCYAVWARIDDQIAPIGDRRKVTLIRTDSGQIRLVPGWA